MFWGGGHGPEPPPPPVTPQLISSVDPKFLKLTKADEQIYGDFRKTFGDLKIDVLDPEELKSEPAKEVGTGGGWNYGVGVLAPPQISPKIPSPEVAPLLPALRGGGGGLQLRHPAAPGLQQGLHGGEHDIW